MPTFFFAAFFFAARAQSPVRVFFFFLSIRMTKKRKRFGVRIEEKKKKY